MQNCEDVMQNSEDVTQNCEDVTQNAEEPIEAPSSTPNGKEHLTSSVPKAARVPSGVLTKGEMAQIREIFGDIDDAEIQRLYKRVTK